MEHLVTWLKRNIKLGIFSFFNADVQHLGFEIKEVSLHMNRKEKLVYLLSHLSSETLQDW